jgi:hypothetical protein
VTLACSGSAQISLERFILEHASTFRIHVVGTLVRSTRSRHEVVVTSEGRTTHLVPQNRPSQDFCIFIIQPTMTFGRRVQDGAKWPCAATI